MPLYVERLLTVDEIKERLRTDRAFLMAAVVTLYEQQESDEQATAGTLHRNGRGFNQVDAPFLTSIAQQVQRSGSLTDRQASVTARLMQKYARQLHGLQEVRSDLFEVTQRVAESLRRNMERLAETMAQDLGPTMAAVAQAVAQQPRRRSRKRERKADWWAAFYINERLDHVWHAGANCFDESTARRRFYDHLSALQEARPNAIIRWEFVDDEHAVG